jgi:peptidyl-prolyl cis-trans isomerase C
MSLCPRLLRLTLLVGAAVALPGLAGAQPVNPAQPQAKPPAPAAQAPAPAAPQPAPPPAQGQAQGQKPPQLTAPPPQLTPPAPKDPVVATVNGQPIYLSELEVAQQALPQQYRSMPLATVFPALLDRIVDSKLVVADAKKNKIDSDPVFKKRLAFVDEQLAQDYWLQREIVKRITPEKMQQRYLEKIKSMPAEEEARARHILVATEQEAKDVLAELKKGTAFEKLAKEKSTDKASGAEGGDLGWFKKGDMVKEFADAAFALKKGETSETPVKTQFGFHVIKMEDRRQAPAPTFEEMADQIREDMARETVTSFIDQLRSTAKIEKFAIDGSKVAAPAAPGAPPPAAPAPPK